MKVRDLIIELAKYDPDANVRISYGQQWLREAYDVSQGYVYEEEYIVEESEIAEDYDDWDGFDKKYLRKDVDWSVVIS